MFKHQIAGTGEESPGMMLSIVKTTKTTLGTMEARISKTKSSREIAKEF